MTRPVIAALVVVFLCACAPSPQQCRDIGVDVPDGAKPTGEIVEEHILAEDDVRELCAGYRGCAIQVGIDKWVIISVDDLTLRQHEACHAYYQRVSDYGMEG